ncbi:MAG: hypothetical protein AMJ79_06450 [Phycisphaerae bacterium SM23_30]|nr:MAG: hypothetical protein AMJ79_06450 [Phycisphaerae bacterium SM23_30]
MKYRILTIAIVVLAFTRICSAVEYLIIDLGELSISPFSGALLCPLSINNLGQVAGCGTTKPGDLSAFVWEDNKRYYITNELDSDWANDINADKLVVGAEVISGFPTPFYWQNGVKNPLPTSLTLGKGGEALAVNDAGKIVGIIFQPLSSLSKAALWRDGGGKELVPIKTLYTDDKYNHASDINNHDKVVGYSGDLDIPRQRAFVWQEGLPPVELALLPGDVAAAASAINNNDRIVGYSADADDVKHAVLWQGGEVIALAPLSVDTWALSLNDNEQVVGGFAAADGNRAFLWEGAKFHDLNNQLVDGEGWLLLEAHDINDDGWIVGVGSLNGASEPRGFLLLPQAAEAIAAEVKIAPQTLNLKSKIKQITCTLQLPEGYDISEVDPSTIRLMGEIEPDYGKVRIDEAEQALMARFSRSELELWLSKGSCELTVSGALYDGTKFEGKDTIRVK